MNNYLLEIGVEEFPAKYIKSTQEQLVTGIEKGLKDAKYTCEEMNINSTPRRFALELKNITSEGASAVEKVKGPAKKIAFDGEGKPSKALQGFMRSKGVEEKDLTTEEINGVEYVFANIETKVEALDSVLKRLVPDVIKHISNPKAMRWGGKNLRFLRPIRWIVSLLDDEVMTFDLEGIEVSNVTKGHRVLGSSHIVIDKIENYEKLLEENYVIVDEKKRRQIILKGLNRLAREKGGNFMNDEELLDEVIQINEYPTPFIGGFDVDYLKLPKEVVVTPMKDHQRYFPIEDDQKKLLPFFISVRNGDSKGMDNVIEGNKKVLVARLEDAKFFYDHDVAKPFEAYVDQTDKLGFHEGLGNMKDKASRLEKLVDSIGAQLKVGQDTIDLAKRAAYLSKADLVTKTVVEFTELQGTMGKIYAANSGEEKLVAQAIEEQYMPRFAGDDLPKSTPGILLSLADKIDSIGGLHALEIYVSGSQDPYGQRRAALGILNILLDSKMNLELMQAFKDALFNYVENIGQSFDLDKALAKIKEFISLRFRNKLIEDGYRYDVVDSVLNSQSLNVNAMFTKVKAVTEFLDADSEDYLTKLIRIKNITKSYDSTEVNEGLLDQADRSLFDLAPRIEKIDSLTNELEFKAGLENLKEVVAIVDAYLDNTMINVEDEAVKNNRLALVNRVSQQIDKIFDPNIIVRG